MSGLFGTLRVGQSGLWHSQIGMDITSQNIANAGVEGYSRRRAEAATLGGGFPGRWARTEVGLLGVQTISTYRLGDPFAESRVRAEGAKQSFLVGKSAAMDRLEAALGEPGDAGLSAAFNRMKSSWADLAANPDNAALRGQVLTAATELADIARGQVSQFDAEMVAERGRAAQVVTDTNTMAAQLAEVNAAIAAMRGTDSDVSTLHDKRDLLAAKLAEATGGVGTINSFGGMDFAIDGQPLVEGVYAGSLSVVSGGPGATADEPLEFDLTSPDGAIAALGSVGGALGAHTEIVNVTVPGYLTGLGDALAAYADQVNAIHSGGTDANGNPGGLVFDYDPADPARTFTVGLASADDVAGNSGAGVIDGTVADALADVTVGERGYRDLVGTFANQVATTSRLLETQSIYTNQVIGAADAISGVNLDEEMLSLVQYQRSYEAAAQVITVADSMLDTLINRMLR